MSGSLVSHSSQTMIWINVRDKDNKPPKFTWKTYTASVKENGSRDQHVVRVSLGCQKYLSLLSEYLITCPYTENTTSK